MLGVGCGKGGACKTTNAGLATLATGSACRAVFKANLESAQGAEASPSRDAAKTLTIPAGYPTNGFDHTAILRG